jgi:hypothetical protein
LVWVADHRGLDVEDGDLLPGAVEPRPIAQKVAVRAALADERTECLPADGADVAAVRGLLVGTGQEVGAALVECVEE